MTQTVIFDWKRTLYDPDNKTLLRGAKEVLDFLYVNHIPMILIGKGGIDMQIEVKRLKVEHYFTHILFAEGKKDRKFFLPYIDKRAPSSSFVIGDRVQGEIEVGNMLGATTIWFKAGKFANELPQNDNQKPTYTVSSLKELETFLTKSIS